MLKSIRQFFDNKLAVDSTTQSPEMVDHHLKLATAALLIETTRADFDSTESEQQAVVDSLLALYELPADELKELKVLAESEVDEHVSLHQFTSLINKHYSPEQKKALIEMMWRVSYADGHADAHEDHLIRKVAGLLYVPHSVFVNARIRAKEAMSGQ